ncbi:MAG: exodeoxyribonuclease V subunit gamma [Methylomonas sp.]|nr:exodeoxyribonuclease V subunit gamma [Methylomonas sp.]PPD20018.1 MAG: exodeoxyribonuclease V subunit gamma [Methylomonas sp.]PPD23914.1 MAG: exodeoxyribonuclease V subunit gamma [Methylomonas sp.]PPD40130.1 MAG: exodeoxyribonuclease V subunit gamma [Methylomonas sp.]PPD51489.1 MAG: exodeoxyribonuclease V subunit gamma [Methylomonas sp.]
MPPELNCGLAVIHGNRLETLADVLHYWLRQYPLAPLENDVVLVQSSGMGQWLKHTLAAPSGLGVAAALSVQLPSLFVWQVYRTVIGESIAAQQPLAKRPLSWRLYRLLPTLASQPGFDSLKHFLRDDEQDSKRHQLAEQLADLYDQYQVYRADWLADWCKGDDTLADDRGNRPALPDDQRWQAALWRCVLADLPDADRDLASRASVHERFLQDIDRLDTRPAALPRRIVVFGLSSLPRQTLDVLVKLGRFCQVVLFVHNPCQHYWADVIDDKDLLKTESRRHARKPGLPPRLHPADPHGHPLLAAWGKQGRDYIRLLEQFDDSRHYADWPWPNDKIDVFADYGSPERRSLLQHLQQAILDLDPLPDPPQTLPAADESLVFHIAHGPQREVEILHDQLLARFNADPSLSPRDIIVMVPDIHGYAPHIRAVFGQYAANDPRHLAFSLADQQQRGHDPLLIALEYLLKLPDARFSVGECLDLLDAPALRKRFGLDAAAVGILRLWLQGAGVRWGLSPEHRQDTAGVPASIDANTWQFGLKRLLLGFAVGDGDTFQGIAPFQDIGGLDARWLGHLWQWLETLNHYRQALDACHCVSGWQRLLAQLLSDFFDPETDRECAMLDAVSRSLKTWAQACVQGGMGDDDSLPLAVVRDAWLAMIDESALHQRFLTGKVNFCTLMPMRAIPFRIVCLLGMNDGDYPRSHFPPGFDLMARRGQYRPGDRSRRDDDHYLFLEAVLSARDNLYISWVGRSIRDNTVKPPSVLVGQLRDVIAQSWRLDDGDLLAQISVEHPLQAFSTGYVQQDRDPRLFTYAREWFGADITAAVATTNPLPRGEGRVRVARSDSTISLPPALALSALTTLHLTTLGQFLRAPVRHVCLHRLKFRFDSDDDKQTLDDEPFAFDRLQSHILGNDLLQNLLASNDGEQTLRQRQQTLARQGQLPLGAFGKLAFERLSQPARQSRQNQLSLTANWPAVTDARALTLDLMLADGPLRIVGETGPLHLLDDGPVSCHTTVQTLYKKDAIDYVRLLNYWPVHLSANASGLALRSLIVGSDGLVVLERIAQTEAMAALLDLATAWQTAMTQMTQPIPVACRTALAWLNRANAEDDDAIRKTYEGDETNDRSPGEVGYDPYLARFYPSFDQLTAACEQGDFAFWSQQLYLPLLLAAKPWQSAT